ncbi:hypothetical protein C8J27_101725 [Rhodobacter aestuarii]|uniref:Uncharacterized protein n=1 Tax=Rhodobacter aestuarii TaxID=453582 RepID=A0A1N7P5Y4_9RHOB|nr:hypothetical protein [Rhodobacter aestuarii]PTV97608.1 hypothetical protein C8J27_101725 [Rhodobacter aestuarii]SIT05936.1 hypothetical protein SAMN05421580_10985 [Rhodobacter aestuarii]
MRFPSALMAPVLVAALATPAVAEYHPQSEGARGHEPALNRHIRMKEGATGAQVQYFNNIITGGMECPEGSTNDEGCIYWDGWRNVFEVTLEGVTETDETELKLGVISAIGAACPGAEGFLADAAHVQVFDGHFYTLEANCPKIDAKGGN